MPDSAVLTFTDTDAYHAAIRDAHAEGVVTGRGDFSVRHATIRLDRLSLQRSEETLPRTMYSAVDPKVFGIVFLTRPGPDAYINGLELQTGEIIAFRAASEGHNRTSGASQWGSIALTHQDIAAAGENVIGRELTAPAFTRAIKPSAPLLSRLLNLHEAAGHLAKTAPDILAQSEVARALEQALLHAMVSCVSSGEAREADSAHHRHAAIMRRLEEFLEASPDCTLYTAELCAATGASDRTLRACCQEYLGMSPMRYLWLRRMHFARRALRMADPATMTVTDVATNYGFWELGRFSVQYRSLFGEPPSTALRRPPDDPRPQKITGSPWRLPESA